MANLDKANRVCLCLAANTLSENLAALQSEAYFDASIDFVELRLDCMLDFSDQEVLAASLERFCHDLATLPMGVRFVLTLRKASDGGRCPDLLDDEKYIKILLRCVRAFSAKSLLANLAYVDLDAALLERAFCGEGAREVSEDCAHLLDDLQRGGVGLIVSVHNFGALPDDSALENLVNQLQNLLARLSEYFSGDLPSKLVFKFALMVSSSAELLRFYRFARKLYLEQNQVQKSYPYILLAMGEYGISNRILRAHTGSLWSFCYPGETLQVSTENSLESPLQTLGQMSLSELIELYHYRNISAQTRIYGVIGNPIRHSRSPEIHNPIYREKGWDAVYLRFCVDSLPDFLALSELLPIFGISVTVPHKESVAQLANSVSATSSIDFEDSVESRVKLLGAANTLYRSAKGNVWFTENTDIEGFLWPLREFLLEFCHNQSLSGQKAAIIGAGGSARAVVYALLQEGMDCEIYNRTAERAYDLQEQFSQVLPGRITKAGALQGGENISQDCLLVVQCTSLGMYEAQSPIPDYRFHAGQIAYDLIYRPPFTAFLQQARREGAFTLNGAAMLKAQAEAQIRLFGKR